MGKGQGSVGFGFIPTTCWGEISSGPNFHLFANFSKYILKMTPKPCLSHPCILPVPAHSSNKSIPIGHVQLFIDSFVSSVHPSDQSSHLSGHPLTLPPIHPLTHLSTHLTIHPPPIHSLSIYLPIYSSVHLPIYPSVTLSQLSLDPILPPFIL